MKASAPSLEPYRYLIFYNAKTPSSFSLVSTFKAMMTVSVSHVSGPDKMVNFEHLSNFVSILIIKYMPIFGPILFSWEGVPIITYIKGWKYIHRKFAIPSRTYFDKRLVFEITATAANFEQNNILCLINSSYGPEEIILNSLGV